MRIEHIAIWTENLERLRDFYVRYFGAEPNQKYKNTKGFESYFLSFSSGARLEIMKLGGIPQNKNTGEAIGITHLAVAVGDNASVDLLFDKMKQDGIAILSEPRTTGDGYYEACISDPDGNKVEITAD